MPESRVLQFPTPCPQCGQNAESLCREDDRHGTTFCDQCGARTHDMDPEPAPTAHTD